MTEASSSAAASSQGLRVAGIVKVFESAGQPPVRVLDGCTFDVELGRLNVLIGPSGCGIQRDRGATGGERSGMVLRLAYRHRHETPPDPRSVASDIPDELAELILEMIEKKPADRTQSADEVGRRLERLARS